MMTEITMTGGDYREAGVVDTRRGAHFKLQAVPVRAVTIGEGFWRAHVQANALAGVPTWLRRMEEHGVVDNFRRAAGRTDAPFRQGSLTSESVLYKWLEAAAFVLQTEDMPELREALDAVIDDIAAAQGEDGYLYLGTMYESEPRPERFTKLDYSHELYCAGHLIQAGIAHYRATGETALLSVGTAYADYLTEEFGPDRRNEADSHPGIEMALIELYRATGERRYLDLAGFFLSLPQALRNLPPIAERPALVDHAVRSGYICVAGADWYAETGDEKMWNNLLRLWEDLVSGKIYITGGVGARYRYEAFGEPYELPNAQAYAETCAQIAHVMWAWRMLLISGEARFADVMEHILYNAFLSGVSLSSTEYFYENPLASDGGYGRIPWFTCNCCPPNVQRTLASMPGLFFSISSEGLWVHLYDTCEANLTTPGGSPVALVMETQYPWQGDIEITVSPAEPEEFGLQLRIPGWAEEATVRVNGEPVNETIRPGSYLTLRRRWEAGDAVRLELPMPVRVMESHPLISENRACVALQRGPVVYCFESTDNPGLAASEFALALCTGDPEGGFRAQWQPQLLGGVMVLSGAALAAEAEKTSGPLYQERGTVARPSFREVRATAIPYYAWANRGDAAMRVWMPVV